MSLFVFAAVIAIMSFGTGLIIWNSPAKAWKVVAWELKQLRKFLKWSLKQALRGIAALCHWAQSKL